MVQNNHIDSQIDANKERLIEITAKIQNLNRRLLLIRGDAADYAVMDTIDEILKIIAEDIEADILHDIRKVIENNA
ncbi:hypothetical protein LCGC14_2172590 [marine sediment metagenome]|uniref:Uncharacterized protein n=1 Tax=marine sediment metagenome TaxID=412755 RepID=A0A0F9G296_9ZZZZ